MNPTRGWDIPGGHIESGESLEGALRRELKEEACVTIKNLRPFLHLHLRALCEKPEGYKYPFPDSYILFFLAKIDSINTFKVEPETTERAFFDEASALQTPWVKEHLEIFEAVLSLR